jgi:hypothetical protein
LALAEAEESRTAPAGVFGVAAVDLAAARLPADALRGRAGALGPPRAAARRALERCGRVRGRLVSTPPSSPTRGAASSLALESATAHIIA